MRCFTVEEIAGRWSVSKAHVRRIIARGELQSFRMGRVVRVTPDALDRFEKEKTGGEDDGRANR